MKKPSWFQPIAEFLTPVIAALLIAAVLVVFTSFKNLPPVSDWVNAGNASEVQAWAAIGQAFFAVVLVFTTIFYAIVTYRIAEANKRMTDLQNRQMRDSTLPVVVFAIEQDANATVDYITLQTHNAGNGPALDVNVELKDLKMRFDLSKLAPLPVALPKEQFAFFELQIDPDKPFAPEFSPVAFTEAPPTLADADQQAAALAAWQQRKSAFDVRVRTMAGGLPKIGTAVATYRDIHGRTMSSSADLIVRQSDNDQTWPRVWIGPMQVHLPIQDQGD